VARLMTAKISYDATELQKNLKEFDEKFDKTVNAIFDMNAAWGEAWMKLNAPWTDDTGAARSGLTAIATSMGKVHEILLAYSVSYGIWLEVANSGKFQILGPAQRVISQKIMQDLAHIFDGKPPVNRPVTREISPIARKAKPVTNKSGSRRSRKAYGQRRNNQ
jgi:hypothetical protein